MLGAILEMLWPTIVPEPSIFALSDAMGAEYERRMGEPWSALEERMYKRYSALQRAHGGGDE